MTVTSYSCRVASLELFTVQHQRDLPGELADWLRAGRGSVLERPWVVVPSAAMRQRLDWDLADASGLAVGISSNIRFLFLEEFVGLVEQLVLDELGITRHDWRVEAIAGRLASRSGGTESWADVLAEASTLDEVVRWRPDTLEARSFAPLTTQLLQSEEWQNHGPLVQRALTLEGLAKGMGRIASNVALYGLANAPGGEGFVKFVSAVAERSRVGVFLTTASSPSAMTWSRSLNDHLSLWSDSVTPTEVPASIQLKGDIAALNQGVTGESTTSFTNDGSVRLLGAVGIARQVEMARDEILRLLETTNVAPHEILVTASDLDAIHPHLERFWGYEKFSEDDVRLPRLAYEVIERPSASFRSRDRLAAQLLSLIGGYVTIEEIDEVLAYPSLSLALGIDEEYRGRLLKLAREGRLAFGSSAAQRAGLEVFAAGSEAGTWNRILARLAITAMMPDDNENADQLGTGDDLFVVGGVRRLFDAIEAAQEDVQELPVRTVVAWCEWLDERFGPFLQRGKSKDSSLERAFEQVRADFPSDVDVAVDFSFFRSYWRSLSESGSKGQTFGRYGVHVAPLPALAMASYRYVVVLGLDEERLPSAQIQSPILSPARVGDPNPRAALLGALALVLRGARDGVVICFNDRNELNGEEAKRSVVMEELIERIGGAMSALIHRGARHGFAIPNDRPVIRETFDSRYEGLGSMIVNASSSSRRNHDDRAQGEGSSPSHIHPAEVTVKQLHRFLRNSASHYVERGLLGSAMSRIELDDHQPRVGFGGLTSYNVRLEVIEHFAGIRQTLNATDATGGYYEILERESVAAEIPWLFKELRVDNFLQKSAEEYKKDLTCFEELSSEEEQSYYRPRTLSNGIVLRVRSASPDEKNPWSVYRDYSSRQEDQPGAPITVRLYPNGMKEARDWRDTLSMLVDLLVMKVQQPSDDYRFPTSTEFFAGAGSKSINAQITYRFTGSAAQAEHLLERLVSLFLRGLDEPLAIGRYTTPMLIEGGDAGVGFKKDREEPLFLAFFGTSLHELRDQPSFSDVHNLFVEIASLVQKLRETGGQRKSGLRHGEGKDTMYLPMVNFVENSKNPTAAAKLDPDRKKSAVAPSGTPMSDDTIEASHD